MSYKMLEHVCVTFWSASLGLLAEEYSLIKLNGHYLKKYLTRPWKLCIYVLGILVFLKTSICMYSGGVVEYF